MERTMFRSELPRVYALRDLIAEPSNPAAYFQNFDASLRDFPVKKRTWLAREQEFQRLDGDSWELLKGEACPYLTACDTNGRAWEQLISILNQARAHNHLTATGCSKVSFIPREKNRKTPDLSAELRGQKVLCEVKTINKSKRAVDIRQAGDADTTENFLDVGFLNKLDSTIRDAQHQMYAYDTNSAAKRIVFIVINFDDPFGEYIDYYFSQIDQHLAAAETNGIDIVFYNQTTAFHKNISMTHAQVINENVQL
jgi:hypothetical protein